VIRHAKASSTASGTGRVGGNGSRAAAATALALAFAVLCLLPTGASAAHAYKHIGNFGSAAQPSFPDSFLGYLGLAVDQSSGDLLVADGIAGTISRFKPDGTPDDFSALGTNVIDGSETPQGSLSGLEAHIAVDESGGATDGNIYVPIWSPTKAIDVFASSGAYLGQLTHYKEGADASGPAAEYGGPGFGGPCGVAVDSSGSVYVSDPINNLIHKYAPAGAVPVDADNVANFHFESPCALAAGAGPTDGFIFPSISGAFLGKLDSASGEEKYFVNQNFGNNATSVDPASGHVFAAPEGAVREYDASGAQEAKLLASIPSEGGGTVFGLAVNAASGNVYVAREGNSKIEAWEPVVIPDVSTEAASEVAPNSAVLHGTIGAAGGPQASCEFQYVTEAAFNQTGGSFQGATSLPCSPAGPFTGSSGIAVSANVSGLTQGTSYRFRLVGTNSNGANQGQALRLQTFGPIVSGVSVTAVSESTATIEGKVDPNGAPTGFTVEYVDDATFQQSGFAEAASFPAPPEEVGSGNGPVEVKATLKGLTPDTTYHFRLVASSEFNGNPVIGLSPEGTFTTFTFTATLPEGRAYEMVSPSLKIGEVFAPEPVLGSRSCGLEFCNPGIDDVKMPVQAAPDGNGLLFWGQPFSDGLAPQGNQYLARRSSGGWSTKSITPLRAQRQIANSFKGYSSDLTKGVLYQGGTALSPEVPAGENSHGEGYSDLYLWEEGNPNLRPLVTVQPPNREPGQEGENSFRLSFGGGNSGTAGSPAFTHLVFEANDALTPAIPGIAPTAPETGEAHAEECGDNISSNGPGQNCNIYEWVNGQLRLVNVLPGNNAAASHAVIGSSKRLTAEPDSEAINVDHAISADGSRIFWSDESGQVYVRIDGEETVKLNDPGQFLTASADGSRVLLNDGCLYSLASESCEAKFGSDPSAFLGMLGASEDLTRVYFVDKEALAPGAQAEACQWLGNQEEGEDVVPPGAGCNLYVYDHGDISHVATLVGQDNRGGQYGDWRASPSSRSAQVSADGRYLTFMSIASLTGYDNRRVGNVSGSCSTSNGAACTEVFQYDLDSQHLSCASCNPSGLQPLGRSNLAPVGRTSAGSFPQLRDLPSEGEGQVFFESQDTLAAGDHNGRVQDVYEWQPEGVGGCARAKGCISLLSGGNSGSDAFFLSSSASGKDAFFATREQLLLKDKDDLYDAYDARVGGGINENTPPPCLGEACKGPATSAPETQTAGTAQFSGPGNEKPHKQKPKKHKHKKKHKSKSKKHAHKRAAESNRGGQK
jgi:hypothetical protein